MACTDHTARVRRLVRNELKSESTSSVGAPILARESDRKRRQLYVSRIADTALALAVIDGVLNKHEALAHASQDGMQQGLPPLDAVQIIGLSAAMELLHHYADILRTENSG
jgi:hypothetical protein